MNFFSRLLHPIRSFFIRHSVVKGSCETKYPILLIHGIAYRDDMILPSWGAVPEYLRHGGASVYLANTDAWASYKTNAKIIKSRIDEILTETQAEKVNLVAHSKGGIDARYAISFYQLAEQVASLTTISTPHKGTCVADIFVKNLPVEANFLYDAVNIIGRVMGDKNPDTNKAVVELTRESMKQFNQAHPNDENIYYQSYGAEMTNPINDPLFAASFLIVNKYEGNNDGLISYTSYQWGEFHEVAKARLPGFGISHGQITGSMFDIIGGVNIPLLYIKWISQLKTRGF